MRSQKYLIAFWVAITLYTLTSIFAGNIGFSAYRDLSRERDKQKLNIEALKAKNKELEGLRDALLYDSDTITVYARDLGFGRDNETFIRIVGLEEKVKQPAAAGEVTPIILQEHISDRILRFFAFYTGLGILALFGLLDSLRRVHTRGTKGMGP
ncbi:MAG: septum formation initiator family protein [Spirochaetaceae bacterium]|jgi:cell division protein FtsB|nr:septum formation initiator family protein [Spirochaetaceae bacterium]